MKYHFMRTNYAYLNNKNQTTCNKVTRKQRIYKQNGHLERTTLLQLLFLQL